PNSCGHLWRKFVHHPREHLIDRSRAVDDDESPRLRDGEGEISLAHTAMKAQLLRFESPFIVRRICVSRSRARQAARFIDVEEQRDVRTERRRCPIVEHAQSIEIEQTSETL